MTSQPTVDDKGSLRGKLKAGEHAALDAILESYWDSVLAYATRMLDSEDLGEEIAQVTFVKLWLSRERLAESGPLGALLFRIARNAALDELKQGGRNAHFVALHENDLRTNATPAEELECTDLEKLLTGAIRAMPIARREVFLLLRFAGLSYKEVARLLELSPQTVANHMSLAIKELRRVLRPHSDLT